jgi:hypothetical protein
MGIILTAYSVINVVTDVSILCLPIKPLCQLKGPAAGQSRCHWHVPARRLVGHMHYSVGEEVANEI